MWNVAQTLLLMALSAFMGIWFTQTFEVKGDSASHDRPPVTDLNRR